MCGELAAAAGAFVMSRRTTCSRALRSRTRNTPGDPLTSNSSVPLTPTLGPGDARDMSADMSVATMSDFSVCDDDSGSSDTRNCAILCSNKQTHTHMALFLQTAPYYTATDTRSHTAQPFSKQNLLLGSYSSSNVAAKNILLLSL